MIQKNYTVLTSIVHFWSFKFEVILDVRTEMHSTKDWWKCILQKIDENSFELTVYYIIIMGLLALITKSVQADRFKYRSLTVHGQTKLKTRSQSPFVYTT